MIVDRLEHWRHYSLGAAWQKAFEFLLALSPEIEDGEYPLLGEDLFARVATYRTRQRGEGILEAHRKYIDIQTVLRGREELEWFPAGGLSILTPYEAERDAEFYQPPTAAPVRVDLRPGLFSMLLPHDAHMPSLVCCGGRSEEVKKVVVKLRVDLLMR